MSTEISRERVRGDFIKRDPLTSGLAANEVRGPSRAEPESVAKLRGLFPDREFSYQKTGLGSAWVMHPIKQPLNCRVRNWIAIIIVLTPAFILMGISAWLLISGSSSSGGLR